MSCLPRLAGSSLPVRCDVGLKPQHYQDVRNDRPGLGFFEVHAENYMVDGGPFHYYLGKIREHYPLSLHGVGLSIGGEDPPDPDHLDRLAKLIEFLSEVVVRTGCGDRLGPTPTLIEWDNDVPDFSTLIAESRRAQCILSDRVDLRQCDTYEACA